MSQSFPLTSAQLVAGYLETLLHAFHTVAFGFGFRYLVWGTDTSRSSKKTVNRFLVAAGVLLWVMGTIHLVLLLYDSVQIFNYQGPGGPTAAILARNWRGHVRSAIFCFTIIIGDLVLVYRCFVIYGRSWMVISVPVILLLAEAGCGMTSFIMQAVIPPRVVLTKVGKALQSVTLATWAITCALTMLTTFLIIFRIWRVERNSRTYIESSANRDSTLMYAMRIIMESGLLYAADMLILLIVYSTGSNGAYPMTDTVSQIIGITFNLIIIRASKHHDNTHVNYTGTQGTSVAFTVPSRGARSSTMFTSEIHEQDDLEPGKGWERQRDVGKIELNPITS